MLPPDLRRRLRAARVAHFATCNAHEPGLVPVCFALVGDTIYHAIDRKPKAVDAMRLARIRNVRANPNAVLLVDDYREDWRRLWYVMVRGQARILASGTEHRRAITALRRKYVQYRTSFALDRTAVVIAIDVTRHRAWFASAAGSPTDPRSRRSGSTRSR